MDNATDTSGQTASTLPVRLNVITGQCAPLPAGAVSWWAAEGDANDKIGVNDGALHGDVDFVPGKVGQAFGFDGDRDYVEMPDDPSLQISDAISVEFWAYPLPQPQGGMVTKFDIGVAGARWHVAYYGTAGGVPAQSVLFQIYDSTNAVTTLQSLANAAPFNAWTHIAGVPDDTTMRLYINGVEVASGPSVPIHSNTTTTLFGAYQRNGTKEQFFSGALDEVGIYNRALSASEVQAIFDASSAGKCEPDCTPAPSGLVSWWPGKEDGCPGADQI